jgi:hypothetical protein
LAIEDDKVLWQELVDSTPLIKEQLDKPNADLPSINKDAKIPNKDL